MKGGKIVRRIRGRSQVCVCVRRVVHRSGRRTTARGRGIESKSPTDWRGCRLCGCVSGGGGGAVRRLTASGRGGVSVRVSIRGLSRRVRKGRGKVGRGVSGESRPSLRRGGRGLFGLTRGSCGGISEGR